MNQQSKQRNQQPKGQIPRRGREKEADGLQATIERLTGKSPCPNHLRVAGNKYLGTSLFPSPRNSDLSIPEKLKTPHANTLLMNALALDEVFRGKTTDVVALLEGDMSKDQLETLIKDAENEMRRRFEIYAYWNQRISVLRSVLLDESIDLKTVNLDEQLNKYQLACQLKPPGSFALRAVNQLENLEQSGRLTRPTANEYTEKADAYMALGDYQKAEENAVQAIELDPKHAQGWFIRVMAALKPRNNALREMQHQRLIATEIAEPMSAHESMAYELEDEAANEAARHHKTLDSILPQALLHWPRQYRWGYEHREQHTIVRDLFLDHAFALISSGGSYMAFHINGLSPEWELKYKNSPMKKLMQRDDTQKQIFSEDQRAALIQLIADYDKSPYSFFISLNGSFMVKEFKLLHLRWVLDLEGYESHWDKWSESCSRLPALLFEESILCNQHLAPLWQMHQARHGGISSILEMFARWQEKAAKDGQQRITDILLQRYAGLYHYQFARGDFNGCANTTRLTQQLTGDSKMCGEFFSLSFENASIPIQSSLYWHYLEALAVIENAQSGNKLDETAIRLLLDAEHWRKAFNKTDLCFWMESDEYEEYEVEPYNQDLRAKTLWLSAINAQLSLVPLGSNANQLRDVAKVLAGSEE